MKIETVLSSPNFVCRKAANLPYDKDMIMNKHAILTLSGIALCAGSALGQTNSSAPQPERRRIIAGTPEQQAAAKASLEQCITLDVAGFTALHEGRYAEAEENARQALAISHGIDLLAPELLAASLDAQGKNSEALAAYQTLADRGSTHPRDLLPYALLLLKNGQWAEAVVAYNKAAPYIAFGQLLNKSSHFTTPDYEPTALAAAIHIGLGLTYVSSVDWAGNSRKEKGLEHLQQALALEPNSPLTNYYYGYGWRRLDRDSSLKAATATQAKAALQKAAASDDDGIKKVAEELLKTMP